MQDDLFEWDDKKALKTSEYVESLLKKPELFLKTLTRSLNGMKPIPILKIDLLRLAYH